MRNENIDHGTEFEFGNTAADYARYRDVYPASMYQKLRMFGIGTAGQRVADMGTGTGVLPRAMAGGGAKFTGVDSSEELIAQAKKLSGGMGIRYKVAPAEHTGLGTHRYNAVTAVQSFEYFAQPAFRDEVVRLLTKSGLFCKASMMWMPQTDALVAEMEALVLRYNPGWTGGGYKGMRFHYPEWAKQHFELETLHCYEEYLSFTKEAWRGRVRSCRGLGASLSTEKLKAFDAEYAKVLAQYPGNELRIEHQIVLEVYRLKPDAF